MVITLLHPSRGRANKSLVNHAEWTAKANGVKFETIVAVDKSDPTHPEYIRNYGAMCYVGENNSVVEATNYAAMRATGDILLYFSDDFKCPDDWANLIIKEFEGVTSPMLLKVDDTLQPFHVPVLTIPIVNRALYERLGYFWHPQYKSMFVDEDLFWTARKLNAIKLAQHLKFPHEHVSVGKAPDDETYRNSAKNWDQGKALFAKRKAAGFPI